MVYHREVLVCLRCHAHLPADPAWCAGCGRDRPNEGWREDPLIGETLADRYRLERRLGGGGGGVIYVARGPHEAPLAVKILGARWAADGARAARFRRESSVGARLRGRGAVRVHEAGAAPDGALFFVMDRLEGVSLEDRLRGAGPPPTPGAVDLLIQLCDLLAELHGLGLLHCDLKPANLHLVPDPRGLTLKVLDFGSARRVGERPASPVFGTPAFMSPEQARGLPLDGRSDIFAAGVCAFALLTGALPFGGEGPRQRLLTRLAVDAPAPSALVGAERVPAALDAVVARALARRPEDRYPDVEALRAALTGIATARRAARR